MLLSAPGRSRWGWHEVYFDRTPAVETAVPPPRKTAGSTTGDEPLPFEVVFLDPERRLPVLVPRRKAA